MEGRERTDQGEEERVIFGALGKSDIRGGRPFLKKSAEFNALAGRMAGIRDKYGISEADWNLLAGDWIAFIALVQSPDHRVDNI